MLRRSYDAVVLGGGVIGCSTAFALANKGAKVALLERGTQIAGGTSSRSSGCIRTHYSVRPNAVIANHALDFWEHFQQHLGGEADAGFVQAGLLHVAADNALGDSMRQTLAMMDDAGIATQFVTKRRAKELHPLLNLDDVDIVSWEPRSGYADPYLASTSFAVAARARGAESFLGCEVTGLDIQGGKVSGVTTSSHGSFDAPIVISCLNVWTGPLLAAWLDESIPVKAEKHCLVSVRAPGQAHRHADGRALPLVKDLLQEAQPYFRPCNGGAELLVGDNLPAHKFDVADPDAWDEAVDFDHVAYAAGLAAHRFPCYGEASLTAEWSGMYDVTPDYNPILGRWPSTPGLSVAAGFSGHGFKIAPIIGQMLADDALGLPPFDETCDIELYSPSRFETGGSPLQGLYEGAAA